MSSNNAISNQLRLNRQSVIDRIAKACARAGRDPHQVQLVAVTKYTPLDVVRQFLNLGDCRLGESRPQQLEERAAQLSFSVQWDFIGHLQRNKVQRVVPMASLIHSVDSARLLERIAHVAAEQRLESRVLLQVNVSGETSKGGFDPQELIAQWQDLANTPQVSIQGLMTMAPLTEDQQQIRNVFRSLRELRDALVNKSPGLPLKELSMGMSHDFEIAVEEGATLVRVGSALFEGTPSIR